MPDDKKKIRVLLTGATGYIGRRLMEQLLQLDHIELRILVRNKNKVPIGISEQVEIYEGDTFNEENLHLALQNIEMAYYLIHSMGSDEDYQKLDRLSAENFRNVCIEKKVKRVIYLGGLGVKESASKHLLSRIETGEILSAFPDKLQTIWFRAGVIIGSGSASFEIIRNLVQKLPVMITPKWVRTKTQTIGIDDVLKYLESSLWLDDKNDQVVDIGSDTLSFQQMMKKASRVMGLKRFLIPVPFLSPRLSSYWLILFTPIPFRLASSLVAGLKSETVLQNNNASRLFPDIAPLSFSESVSAAGKELEQNQVLSRWCDSSGNISCDIKDFDDPEGAVLRDVRSVEFASGQTQEKVFLAACSLGGEKGWFRYDILWKVRGLIDKLMGGYGLNRGRRDSGNLRVGDALDFWKVADLKNNKRVLLFAQMKLPGKAWLEFDIQHDRLVQTAHFIPRGVLGRLYWWSVYPLHHFVFSNLAKQVVKTAY